MPSMSPSIDHQLFLQSLSALQYEAAGRDGVVKLISESRMKEENLMQAWISLVQSFAASLNSPTTKYLGGVDSPKLHNNLDYFLKKCSEEKFKSHFRVNKKTYLFLHKSIRTSLEVHGARRGKPRIRGDVQLAATLW